MSTSNETVSRHRAGLFDIRNIIGLLLMIYGVVLLVMGLVATSAQETARAGGINANLWVGIALLVVGGLFVLWAVTRPIVVPDEIDAEPDPAGDSPLAP
jgi:uncharacterized membrane protein YidH (DUF202 family)